MPFMGQYDQKCQVLLQSCYNTFLAWNKFPKSLDKPGLLILKARKAELFLAKVAKKARSQNKQGHESQALGAKVAKKAWLWPCLPGFTTSHFPGKSGQKPGMLGLASLCLPGREFGQAPDARVADLKEL